MPAAVDRMTLSRGPAVVKYKGGIFFSKGDIELDWGITNANVDSSAYGPVLPYRTGLKPTLKVPLVGEIEHLEVLYPFATLRQGASIFGPTDTPLEIIPMDSTQDKIVFHSGALVQEPDLTLGVSGGVALGETSFRFLPRKGATLDSADAWFTRAENDWDGAGFDPAKILIQSYDITWLSGGKWKLAFGGDETAELAYNVPAAALETALNALASVVAAGGVTVTGDVKNGWVVTFDENGVQASITGSVTGMPGGTAVREEVLTAGAVGAKAVVRLTLFPWHYFPSEDAVKVSFKPTLSDQSADSIGVYDVVFKEETVTVSFTPLNVNDAVLTTAANVQGARAALGVNVSEGTHHFNISAPGLHVRVYGAIITKAGLLWSSEKQRVQGVEWQATRTVAGGAVAPLYYVGDVAPAP